MPKRPTLLKLAKSLPERFLNRLRLPEPEPEMVSSELRTISLWDSDVDAKVEHLKSQGFAVVDLHVSESPDGFWGERILILRRPLYLKRRRI